MISSDNFFVRIAFPALVFIIFFSACSIHQPSLDEQMELSRRGSMPGGQPPWAARPRSGGGFVEVANYMPATLQAPRSAVDGDAFTVFAPEVSAHGLLDRRERNGLRAESAKVTEQNDVVLTTLERVKRDCPSGEGELEKISKTTSPQRRLAMLNSLSGSCPQSGDIWYLLGEEYFAQKRISDAMRCAERATVLNPELKEAKELVARIDALGSGQ